MIGRGWCARQEGGIWLCGPRSDVAGEKFICGMTYGCIQGVWEVEVVSGKMEVGECVGVVVRDPSMGQGLVVVGMVLDMVLAS